jgi:antitoxin FitA
MPIAILNVRNVDEVSVTRLKERAARHGRSAEAEHREILKTALEPAASGELRWEERAAQLREKLKGRIRTSSEVLIREDRDSR